MDLQEWVKKGNVWKLESEAFKKPIEIKIWYDNHELASFKEDIEWLRHSIELHDSQITKINWENVRNYLFNEEFQNKVNNKQQQINELREKIENQNKEISSLYKVIADLKTTVETLSWTILHLQEQTSLIQKKITKQPTIIHDKCFISGRESCGIWMIDMSDGDYLLIMNTKVGEHNEYVTNKDELIMEKIHVEGQHYVPFYKLEWGTELDTPTATIYYDLVFIPM